MPGFTADRRPDPLAVNMPNIVITSGLITVQPDVGSTWSGSTIYLSATIVNNGSNPVNRDFPLNFYRGDPDVDNDGLIDPGAVLIDSVMIVAGPAIPKGQQRTVSSAWTTTAADVGTFTIYAVADPDTVPPFDDGLIDEVDAVWAEVTDNKAFYDTSGYPAGAAPPFVTATPPDYEVHGPAVPKANLAVTGGGLSVSPDFGSAYVGSAVFLNATIWNLGAAAVANDFDVGFYRGHPDANADGVVDAASVLLGSMAIPASLSPIGVGASATASVGWTPGAGDLGAFTLYAAADLQASGPFSDAAVDEQDNPGAEIADNLAFYDTGGYPAGAAPPFVTAVPPDYEVLAVPVPAPTPSPPQNVTLAPIGPDRVLSWDVPLVGVPDEYEVYKGATPRGIDLLIAFATVPPAPRVFVDPGAAASPGEAYYVLRAVNQSSGMRSATSVTVGAFTVLLPAGRSAIALPLEPFQPLDAPTLAGDLGATDLQVLDAAGSWISAAANASLFLSVGAGYMVDLPAATLHTFVGSPGSSVLYDGSAGFDAAEASSLTAATLGSDILLAWAQPAAAVDRYCIRRSATRIGFHTGAFMEIACTASGNPATTTFVDPGAAATAGAWHYLVVPVNASGGNGSTTFSVGVWTGSYSGWHAVGLPLRPFAPQAVSWYAAQIPLTLGILWWSPTGRWVPHFAAMAPNVYDAPFGQGVGVQVAVQSPSVYSFIGT